MRLRYSHILACCLTPLVLGWMWTPSPSPVAGNTFKACITASSKAWKAGKYSACIAQLGLATELCKEKQRELIASVLPKVPKGWSLTSDSMDSEREWNVAEGVVGTFSVLGLDAVDYFYEARQGAGSMRLKIAADSPGVQLMKMFTTTPGLLGKGQELLTTYSGIAVLTIDGENVELHVQVGENGMAIVSLHGGDKDLLLSFFDKKAVDRITKVLAE